MTINLVLSTDGINKAIQRLQDIKDNLQYGIEQSVDILAKNGTAIANLYYRSMADASYQMPDDHTAVIRVGGDVPLIAEFGAGDATIPGTGFENKPDTPVFRGSYSLLEGSQQYWDLGMWEFPPGSNNWMKKVEPRRGLFEAKEYIVAAGTNIAKGVIKL